MKNAKHDVIALFQDDIILNDRLFRTKIFDIFDSFPDKSKIGLMGGRSGFEFETTEFPEKPTQKVSNWEHLPNQYGEKLALNEWKVRTFLNRGPLVFTKSLIDEVGYLDEGYYPQWGDDMDYCARAHYLRGRNNIVFECAVKSELSWGGTRQSDSKLRKGRHYKPNWELFVSKWGGYINENTVKYI